MLNDVLQMVYIEDHIHIHREKNDCIWMRIMFYRKLRCLILQILHQDVWIIHNALRATFPRMRNHLTQVFPLLSFRHSPSSPLSTTTVFLFETIKTWAFFGDLMHLIMSWSIEENYYKIPTSKYFEMHHHFFRYAHRIASFRWNWDMQLIIIM